MSIWWAQWNSQGRSSAKTPCGPLVATALGAAWSCHVCHIPPCHPTRRRAVSWLSSRHTWMMPLRLGVKLCLAFVTTRTCFLIHLVQRSVGWRLAGFLFLPVTLLSDCLSFNCFDFVFPSHPSFIHHCILTEFFFFFSPYGGGEACTSIPIADNSSPSLRGLLPTLSHLCSPGEQGREEKPLCEYPWSLP